MFYVFEGDKHAKYPECKVDTSWNNNCFLTFEEAEDYALNWLECYGPDKGVLKVNVPHEFQENCFIIIKELHPDNITNNILINTTIAYLNNMIYNIKKNKSVGFVPTINMTKDHAIMLGEMELVQKENMIGFIASNVLYDMLDK